MDDNPQCLYVPGPNEFDAPTTAWWWPYTDATGTTLRNIELPEFDNVMSTPAVVRLHGKNNPQEPPAVVFNSFSDGGLPNVEGVLRAIRGDNGEPIFTVTAPSLRSNGLSSPAVGDLLGDGNVEIVVGAYDTHPGGVFGGVMAFRPDGTLLWKTPDIFTGWGGAAIADLDGDGKPEVVIGNIVLNGQTGARLCDGGYSGIGDNNTGPLSTVADIDGDGLMEILTGDMAYKPVKDANGQWTCQHMWPDVIRDNTGAQLDQGFTAVADLVNDPAIPTTVNHPEVAVVSKGTLRVQDWTGGVVMDPVPLPGGGYGGPPTIADFDGDGQPEIGVAGKGQYTVFKPNAPNPVLWTVQTQDFTSSVTGSSVFNFLGNKTADVIYNDECYVHVYNGTNGNILFETANTSCTAYEMPVVADVDGSGEAGLLVPANNFCGIECPYGSQRQKGMRGMRLFKSRTDSWVASRPIWNQHTFHMTNVTDDGEIPAHEPRFWGSGTLNAFRQNYQGRGDFAVPDLIVTKTWLDGTMCPHMLRIVADVANIGSRGTMPGLNVAFYEDTPAGRQLLGVSQVSQALQPHEHAQVYFDWLGSPRVNRTKVVAVADDDGTGHMAYKECNVNNNSSEVMDVACYDPG